MNIKPLGNQPRPAAGIHSIDHFALAVPDLRATRDFLSAFGLRINGLGNELELRVDGNEHVWGRVLQTEGPRKRLEYLAVGCFAADIEALHAQVVAAGGAIAAPHRLGRHEGFWFTDPDGNLVQVKVGAKTMPDFKARLTDECAPAGARGSPPRSKAPVFRPTRLAHVALFTPNVSRAVDFYQQALGVLLADRSREIIAFTYGRHGSDHHLLAFLASGAPGLHHSSWDVGAIGAVGLGAERLRAAGYVHQWGLGKHVLGSNYFNYIRDSTGQWWEHICDIDYIPKDAPWAGGDYDEEDGFYLWGPSVPADFGTNTEI
jgi:catechol 2,3-dioxygenase-like lactoylglutathione lyase family enzyme